MRYRRAAVDGTVNRFLRVVGLSVPPQIVEMMSRGRVQSVIFRRWVGLE